MSAENPMLWDCETDGCYNKLKRPDIHKLNRFLGEGCQFGDVDGMTERHGYMLMVEWKSWKGELPAGQDRAHKALTRPGQITTIQVAGEAKADDTGKIPIYAFRVYVNGETTGWRNTGDMYRNFDDLGRFINKWWNAVNKLTPAPVCCRWAGLL